jgi:hypothetical protein
MMHLIPEMTMAQLNARCASAADTVLAGAGSRGFVT